MCSLCVELFFPKGCTQSETCSKHYIYIHVASSCRLYDLAMLCSVNTTLPVTLEKPTMLRYITIIFFHTPLRPGQVIEENEIRLNQP